MAIERLRGFGLKVTDRYAPAHLRELDRRREARGA